MWRAIAWILLGCVVGAGSREATAQDGPRPGHLLARSSWTRLDVVLGRIKIVNAKLGQKLTLAAEHPDSGARELLCVSADSPGSASLHYEFLTDQQQLAVDVERSEQMLLQRTPRPNTPLAAVRYVQPPRGAVRLVVEDAQGAREMAAPSLWHLALAEPDACGQHLLPILEGLRVDWRLAVRVEQLEGALLNAARSESSPPTEQIRKLVEQLKAADFQTRQAADRQLRTLGPVVLAYVDSLPDGELAAEQRTRLAKIRETLSTAGSETPGRVAARLVNDPSVWLALLDRTDQDRRVLAANRLALLTGKPLDFDPRADAAERQRQLAQLRTQLGFNRDIALGSRGTDTRLR
jgi:hypothetical protein